MATTISYTHQVPRTVPGTWVVQTDGQEELTPRSSTVRRPKPDFGETSIAEGNASHRDLGS